MKYAVYGVPNTTGRQHLRDKKIESDTPGRLATAHGFRSSFRDWASESGYLRDLAEGALAHTIKNAVEAAYRPTDLLKQRRTMMLESEGCCVGPEAAVDVRLSLSLTPFTRSRSFIGESHGEAGMVDWFNHRRLLERIGNIPPAEAE